MTSTQRPERGPLGYTVRAMSWQRGEPGDPVRVVAHSWEEAEAKAVEAYARRGCTVVDVLVEIGK